MRAAGRRLAQRRQRVHAVDAGQMVVEQDQVGLQFLRAALRFAGIGGVADHFEHADRAPGAR